MRRSLFLVIATSATCLASLIPAVGAEATQTSRLVRAFNVELSVPESWHVVYEATDFWASAPGGPAQLEATVNPAPHASLSEIGAETVRRLRSHASKAHPSTQVVQTTVGGAPALLLTWQYDATYDYGPNGGSPHHVRLTGRDYLFVHGGRLYDFSYQTIRHRLQADGHVFSTSIASLRFTA